MIEFILKIIPSKYSVSLFEVVLLAVNSILNCLTGSTVLLNVKLVEVLVLYKVFKVESFVIQPLFPA